MSATRHDPDRDGIVEMITIDFKAGERCITLTDLTRTAVIRLISNEPISAAERRLLDELRMLLR